MEKKNFASYQRKEGRKRTLLNLSFLNLQTFIFLFLISYLSVSILNQETSQITLTIKGNGNQRLINSKFSSKISQVLVDGGTSGCKDTCNLSGDTTHNIVIKLSNDITDCGEMFMNVTNIIKINLENFYI